VVELRSGAALEFFSPVCDAVVAALVDAAAHAGIDVPVSAVPRARSPCPQLAAVLTAAAAVLRYKMHPRSAPPDLAAEDLYAKRVLAAPREPGALLSALLDYVANLPAVGVRVFDKRLCALCVELARAVGTIPVSLSCPCLTRPADIDPALRVAGLSVLQRQAATKAGLEELGRAPDIAAALADLLKLPQELCAACLESAERGG
jgi:hypothetical protein